MARCSENRRNDKRADAPALRHLQDRGETDAAGLAAALSINEESAAYLIAHMAGGGKVHLSVRPSGKSKTQ
jgi:hypothetical protein